MKEEVKKETIFSKFKEIWSNKRYRSLILLGFWMIFFVFVYFVMNNNDHDNVIQKPKEVEVTKTTLDKYKEMKNYTFNLEINTSKSENSIYSYTGKTYQDITILNDKYLLKDNTIYEINGNQMKVLEATLFEINIFKLKPNNINNLISLGQLNYETKYNDGSIEKSFLIPLKEIIKDFKGEEVADLKSSVEIKYKEKDNWINEITVDLSNYYEYETSKKETYIIKITYNNINQIEQFKTDYQLVV